MKTPCRNLVDSYGHWCLYDAEWVVTMQTDKQVCRVSSCKKHVDNSAAALRNHALNMQQKIIALTYARIELVEGSQQKQPIGQK